VELGEGREYVAFSFSLEGHAVKRLPMLLVVQEVIERSLLCSSTKLGAVEDTMVKASPCSQGAHCRREKG
jgi:hypothetical protein